MGLPAPSLAHELHCDGSTITTASATPQEGPVGFYTLRLRQGSHLIASSSLLLITDAAAPTPMQVTRDVSFLGVHAPVKEGYSTQLQVQSIAKDPQRVRLDYAVALASLNATPSSSGSTNPADDIQTPQLNLYHICGSVVLAPGQTKTVSLGSPGAAAGYTLDIHRDETATVATTP